MASTLTALQHQKLLQERFVREEDERPTVGHDEFSDAIPVISFSGVDDDNGAGSCSRRSQIRDAIARASEDWGIFHLVDHGIDTVTISQMTSFARRFFALPDEDKLRYDMSGGKKGGFIVSSHLQGEAVQDWREIVTYFTYPKGSRDYGRWPEKPEGWREVTEAYSEKLMELGCKLLELLSEAMGLEKKAIEKASMELDQKVVVNYYPPCPQPELALGLKRHTDPGTLTLLLQDDVGGLQATRDGGLSWITVRPVEGAFVVNIGDHGHYLSNGRFKSADHRAVVNAGRSRLSVATFQNPAPNAAVYPLKVGDGEELVLEKAITFTEMYKLKMAKDLEMARLKKLEKEEREVTLIQQSSMS